MPGQITTAPSPRIVTVARHAAPALISTLTAARVDLHQVPLLRLLHQGRLTLHLMPRGCCSFEPPRTAVPPFRALIVIGDDDAASHGPNAFPAAAAAFRWARAVAFNAAGADPTHYQAAGELALNWHAAVLVETTSAQLGAWHALAAAHQTPPGLPLGFTVLPGQQQPAAQEPTQ
jgi:hypothetical protein